MALSFREYSRNDSVTPAQLVIIMHGYGANADDLLSLAVRFSQVLPDAHFILPNAPHPFEGDVFFSNAYQWFSLAKRERDYMLSGIRGVAGELTNFIEEQLSRFRLTQNDLVLSGFSQGAMMALHVGTRMQPGPRGLLCYSGMIVAHDILKDEVISKPKVLMINGADDTVLRHAYFEMTYETLKSLSFDVTYHLEAGLDHAISENGIKLGCQFLKSLFI